MTQAPYLQQEGNLKENQRTSKTINGKKFIKIAADSLLNETGFSFGKLFYEGELRVFIHSENNNTKDFQTSLYVQAKDISPSQVLSVETEYEIPLTRPSIEGTVSLQAGDNTVGIRDAIVKVSFDREDVLYNIPNTPLITPPTQISTGGALSQDQSPIYQISSTESNLIGQSTAYTPEGLAFPMQMSSSTETGNLSLSPAVNISEFESPFAQISPEIINLFRPNPDDYGRHTARTDSKGHYFVGDLPELKDGAQYTVEVVSVPSQYENMEISPANGTQSISVNKGRVEIADFIIEAEAVPLTGRVVDINGKGLGNAKLYFNGGKTFFESDEKGYFQTSFSPGTHVLNIEKRGYSNKKGNVVIYGNKKPEAKKPLIEEVQSTSNTESTGFMSTSNFQVVNGSLVNGQISSPAFPISSTVVDHIVNKPEFDIKENEYIGEIGYLKEKRAKVKFIVKDADNASKVLKNTTISLFDQSHKTDTNGEWIYEGLGGNAEVTLFPDDGSPYIPIIHAVDLGESDDLITVILTMEEGVRLYGKVTSNLQNLDSANVTVEGNDLFVALTVNGQYELYVPRGEQRIRAAKQGYMVKKEYHTFVKGTDVELNFELEDGGGRNIAQLLGFDIELEQKTSIGNNQEKWSGKFVHLKPYLSVFKSVGNLSLSFSDIKVSFDENGNAIPEGDKITVAETQLPVDLFNFLPVSFKNGGEPIVVRKNSNGWGSISGQMEFDIDRLLGDYDLKFVRRYYPKIVAQLRGHGTPGDIEFFLGEGASGLPGIGEANTQAILGAATLIPGVQDAYNEVGQYVVDLDELKFRLAPQGTEPLKFELYGFELNIDAANTIVSPQGITLEGNLITPEFGIIKSMDIPLNTVKFNTFLRLTEFDVPEEYLPTLEIGDWKAALTRVNISENGLKLNGNMEFQLPYSEKTLMTMTDLKVSPDGIFGGKFKISGGRLDIFGAADLKNRLEDFSFSQIGSSGIYALTGSAELMLKKLFEERFELDRFMVQTNGVFDIQIPYDYSTDLFNVASFNMNAIRVENPQVGMPYIELLGDIRSNVSLLTFNASNFKLVATQSGSAELVVESIGARINTSILNSSLNLSIVQTGSRKGFSGNGSLTIPSTSIGGEVGFYMFKNSNGSVELGANFKAGVPIPIGVVTINEVGGGFEYSSAGNKFLVNITGAISITGLDAVVELKPISLTVESGPVISGTTGVEVAELTLASASIVLNFPLKNFIITVDSKLEPIKGVAKADIEGLLRISWDNNPYAFLGVNAKINVVNLLNAEGTYVIAVNIRNPKTDTKFSRYFASMPTEYATNKFSGLYSNAQTYFGKKKKWDISIASLTVIFNMVTQAGLILNFQENKYLLSLNGSLAGTVKVGVFWDVIDFGAKYGSCYSLLGSYTPAKGWYVGGDASVSLELYAGSGASRLSCNDYNVMPPAAKVCFGAHASINYQQKGAGSGLSVSGGAGAKGAKCSTSPRVTY